MKTIIIIGAGAIGRGYMPWVFEPGRYDFVMVDSNPELVEGLRSRKQYTSWRSRNGVLEPRVVPVREALYPQDLDVSRYSELAAIFVNVGPRNVVKACQKLGGARCPIIFNENDPQTVVDARAALGMTNLYFGVPDVITSNTAPAHLLAEDPLAIVTEDGELFLDDRAQGGLLEGDLRFLPEKELLFKQWTAKLYIHNTPHCVAAYLGALAGQQYLHEGMTVPTVDRIVEGCMQEMLTSLKLTWEIPHEFLDWYAAKELARFRNQTLFDPISRVAREPLRKLEVQGRLLGAANICLAQGFVPSNLLKGIVGALLFSGDRDADKQLRFMWKHLSRDVLLVDVLGLRRGEALEIILSQRIDRIAAELAPLMAGGTSHV